MKTICSYIAVYSITLIVLCLSQGITYGQEHESEEGEDIFLTPDFSYKRPVSVAILPFSNDTGDEELDWLSGRIY